jgi:ABC-2 type transport system permease protein
MLPQLFTAGVFAPMNELPPILNILSHISPMRYAVDLTRGVFYSGHPDYAHTVAYSPMVNLTVMSVLFVVFLVAGTYTFVKRERDR